VAFPAMQRGVSAKGRHWPRTPGVLAITHKRWDAFISELMTAMVVGNSEHFLELAETVKKCHEQWQTSPADRLRLALLLEFAHPVRCANKTFSMREIMKRLRDLNIVITPKETGVKDPAQRNVERVCKEVGVKVCG